MLTRTFVVRAASPPTTTSVTPFKGGIIPAAEGEGDYIRNTTLKKRFEGYSTRWRHYSGALTNYGKLPWEDRTEAFTYGTWFAIPHVGRRAISSPLFHIITSNHNIQPYLYPEMFPDEPSLRFYGRHDFSPEITTSTFDGLQSSSKFVCDIEEGYAHPNLPLNISICHLSHADSTTCLKRNFITDKSEVSDEVQFPFHIQMLAFDCRPVFDGEVLMVHGHSYSDSEDVTPRLTPIVLKCKVTSSETMNQTGIFFIEPIDPEDSFVAGMSGSPVLRDGRVVGLLTTVKTSTGEGIVSISLHLRKLLLGIEERWRYPTPPPFNFLKQRGMLSDAEQDLKRLPERYDLPSNLPRPLSSVEVREFIDTKINNPLPVDFAPPKLLSQGRHQVVSRDRTNPYGLCPPDGGHDIPSLAIFPGYPPAPLVQDDSDKPPWLLRYGSQDNYLLAHGVDPADTSQYEPFRNYISPDLDRSINRQALLEMEEGERPFGILRDKTEVANRGLLIKADDEAEELASLQERFGDEEYVAARKKRVTATLAALKAEEKLALESGDQSQIDAAKAKIKDFFQLETDISWTRGDLSIRPVAVQKAIPSSAPPTTLHLDQSSRPPNDTDPPEAVQPHADEDLSPDESVRLKIKAALENRSDTPPPQPVDENALRSLLSKNTTTPNDNDTNTKDIIWGKSSFSLDDDDDVASDVANADYTPIDHPQQ